MLIRAAKAAGVNKIYVQHPNHEGFVMSMTQMKEAVRFGPQKTAEMRALGPQNVILSTDLGQPGRMNYAQAFHITPPAFSASSESETP